MLNSYSFRVTPPDGGPRPRHIVDAETLEQAEKIFHARVSLPKGATVARCDNRSKIEHQNPGYKGYIVFR